MWLMQSSIESRHCDVEPRERLKRYLEQRRELGERELVLDGMTVEDVLKIVGAAGAGAHTSRSEAPAEPVEVLRPLSVEEPAAPRADWREALRASGADPSQAERPVSRRYEFPRPADAAASDVAVPAPMADANREVREVMKAPTHRPAVPDAPAGIVVGTVSRDLFGAEEAGPSSLEEIAEAIRKCTKCRLYATATNAVPGEGDAKAELVCVGEAPGANEDATGRPFVGQAGQLLTKILAAINLRREDVFICNVLKHRPPGNRNPLPDEVSACSPYLVQQLEVIRPKVIVAFGTFAAQTLLNTKLPIGKLRGSVHRYYGMPLIVTYHPAALLRNPAWKRPTWEDVQLARRILDSVPRA